MTTTKTSNEAQRTMLQAISGGTVYEEQLNTGVGIFRIVEDHVQLVYRDTQSVDEIPQGSLVSEAVKQRLA